MAPTLPPELERSIIVDYVDDDHRTLRSCALVCGRFCYWAQSRLFHTITIGGSEQPGRPWMKRRGMGCLIPILETSPHLLSLVHCIILHDSPPHLLAALASFCWVSLEALHLGGIPRGDEAGVLDNLKLLVSAPDLRTLELDFAGRSWNAGYFRYLLVHCSSTLTELRLMDCHDDYAGLVHDYALPPVTQQCRPLPRINRLTLTFSSGAIAVFNEPLFSPFLTHMRHLGYLESPHDSLGPLLCRIGQNVESLIVDTNDETLKDFHFGLPSLCRLECQFSLGSVWNVVARLPDGSRLTDLVLTTSHHVWQFKSSGEHALGLRLEQLVLRKLLCLRALVVEVMVVTPRYETQGIPPLDRKKVVRAIEKSMPRLTEKRILSVRFFFEKKRGLYY